MSTQKLLISEDARFAECHGALRDEVPKLQVHVTNALEASRVLGFAFVTGPASLEEVTTSLGRLIPNNTSSILNFSVDIEGDTREAMQRIKAKLLEAGDPVLSVGGRSTKISPEKLIELDLVHVDENQVRGLVLARRALDNFVRDFPELLPYVSIDDTGHVIVDKAVDEFLDTKFCRYANTRQLAAWQDLTAAIAALKGLRDTHGLTLDQIVRHTDEGPDGTLTISPAVLELVGQIRSQKNSDDNSDKQ